MYSKVEIQPYISDLNLCLNLPRSQYVLLWGVGPELHCDFRLFERTQSYPLDSCVHPPNCVTKPFL